MPNCQIIVSIISDISNLANLQQTVTNKKVKKYTLTE